MHTVHSSYSASLSHDRLQLTELYILELANDEVVRLTSHGSTLSWDSPAQSYIHFPIARGPIRHGLNLEFDTLDITFANMAGELFDKVQKNYLDQVKITIKRIYWSEPEYDVTREMIVFVGTADVEFDRMQLILHCRPLLDSLNLQIPGDTFEEPCNNILFGDTCGLTQSDFLYSGTATGGSTSTLEDSTRGLNYKVDFDGGDEDNPIDVGDTVTGGGGGGTGVVTNIIYLTAETGTIWYVEQAGAQFVDDEVLSSGGDSVTVNGTPATDSVLYRLG
ncbi:MAG: baseplate hub domain-containing protein, partial [Planctomycetota bacterium]